ncbi:MAG: hypothetical protein ACRDTH_07860 [Pseudonocardiaceae bacterium]
MAPLREALRLLGQQGLVEHLPQFHVALVAMAGHRHLLLVYEPVILKLQLYMAANLRREAQVGTPQDGVRRHRRLSRRWQPARSTRSWPSSAITALGRSSPERARPTRDSSPHFTHQRGAQRLRLVPGC